jgi:fatty acid-binding protein 3, muscle and heart
MKLNLALIVVLMLICDIYGKAHLNKRSIDKLLGEWKLESSENFDAVMEKLGVGWFMRKLGNMTKPNVRIEKKGNEWIITTSSAVKTHVTKFELDKEFDEETLDGRRVKSTYRLVDDKLISTSKEKGVVTSVITREVASNGKMITTVKAGDVIGKRVYSKI